MQLGSDQYFLYLWRADHILKFSVLCLIKDICMGNGTLCLNLGLLEGHFFSFLFFQHWVMIFRYVERQMMFSMCILASFYGNYMAIPHN